MLEFIVEIIKSKLELKVSRFGQQNVFWGVLRVITIISGGDSRFLTS